MSLDIIHDCLAYAKKKGASNAEIFVAHSKEQSIGVRMGKKEESELSEHCAVGIKIFDGLKESAVSASSLDKHELYNLIDRALIMAKELPENPYAGLADPDLLCTNIPTIDTIDATEPSPEILLEKALMMEEIGLSKKGITNSEGAQVGMDKSSVIFGCSNGFSGALKSSNFGMSASFIAGQGSAMETDYDYAVRVYWDDLPDPTIIGDNAANRALQKLHPKTIKTGTYPVIFAPRVATSLIGHLASAINGSTVARGSSFLQYNLGEQIFDSHITIMEDPFLKRGLGSRPHDGEGLQVKKSAIIDQGVLVDWVLDLQAARQLNMKPNGHAGRSLTGVYPSLSNIIVKPSNTSYQSMISTMKQGLLITDLMGQGANIVTGDYSRGVAGFWIENGHIAHPVNEVTIAGHLKEMFKNMHVADDLVIDKKFNSPSILVESMTIASNE